MSGVVREAQSSAGRVLADLEGAELFAALEKLVGSADRGIDAVRAIAGEDPIGSSGAHDDSVVGTKRGDELSRELWHKRGEGDRQLEEAVLRVRNRFAVDRTAAIDQISGDSFTSVRQAQLAEIPGAGYLAGEYGLKAAYIDHDFPETIKGIRVSHPLSTGYMRDLLPKGEASPFKAMYEQRTREKATKDVFFLNAPSALEKMRTLYAGQIEIPEEPGLIALPTDESPVCWAVKIDPRWTLPEKSVWDPDKTTPAREAFDTMIHMTGATPSTHQAYKQLAAAAVAPPVAEAGGSVPADNGAVARGFSEQFESDDEGPYKTMADVPADHPAKATADSVKRLLGGLEFSADYNHDLLVANGLKNLDRMVKAMASCLGDARRLSQLYDLFVEELYLVLARTKPYDKESFQASERDSLKTRAPALGDLETDGATITPYLVASGMDALTTAVVAAMKEHGDDAVTRSEGGKSYFEVGMLLDHSGKTKEAGHILIATLNPSTPEAEPAGVESLLADVHRKLGEVAEGRVTLVLDVTLEKGGDEGATDLNAVFADEQVKTAINDERLKVILCKSFQKYSTMGSGKVMAGNLTMVGKGVEGAAEAFVSEAETDQQPYESDEAQLMTHMRKHGTADEIAMMQHAASNATLVHEQCWPDAAGRDWNTFEEGLPFVMAPITVELGDADAKPIDMVQLCAKMGLDWRESFSFQQSSCLLAGSAVRINLGQESSAGAIEKTYAIGQAAAGGIKPTAVSAAIDRGLEAYKEGSVDDEFVGAKVASQLLLSAKVINPESREDQRRLRKQLGRLLALDAQNKEEPPARLTPEMRANLSREYLRLQCKESTHTKEAVDAVYARKDEIGNALRTAYEAAGGDQGWDSHGGRQILVAMNRLAEEGTADAARALGEQCEEWLGHHPPDYPNRDVVQSLLKQARQLAQAMVERQRDMLQAVSRLPYAEDAARFLIDDAPDEAFGSPTEVTPLGKELLAACLRRLDLQSQIAVYDQLAASGGARAAACLRYLEDAFATGGASRALAPETLATDVGEESEDAPPERVSEGELQVAQQRFLAAQCRTWQALSAWIAKPRFDIASLPRLKEIQTAMGALVETLETADAIALESRARALGAALSQEATVRTPARGLDPTLATIVERHLDTIIDRLRQAERQAQIDAKKEELQRVVGDDREAMVRTAIESAPADAADASAAAKLDELLRHFDDWTEKAETEAAKRGGVGNFFEELKRLGTGVVNQVDLLDRVTPQQQALFELLKDQITRHVETQTAALEARRAELAAMEPQDPAWFTRLAAALDAIQSAFVNRLKEDVKELDPTDLDAVADFKKEVGRNSKAKGLANEADLWPPVDT